MRIKVNRVVQQGRNFARAMIDDRLGNLVHHLGGMTFDAVKLQREIEQQAVTVTGQRFAPHVFTITLDWATRTGAATTAVKELENEVLVTAMDYIEDHRFNIFAPVQIVTEDDIYADSIVITPSFGTERRLGQDHATPGDLLSPPVAPRLIKVFVRLSLPGADRETVLRFEPCLRLTIGRLLLVFVKHCRAMAFIRRYEKDNEPTAV